MITHFLRFTDEAAFTTALTEAGFTSLLSHTHIFDVIGPIAQVLKRLAEADDERSVTIADGFTVALNDDHTGWLYQFTPPADLELEPGETITVTLAVDFGNQNTGDFDSKTIVITTTEAGYTIEQLIFDEDGNETGRETPTNTTDTPGSSFDAWHVNAKLQELPAGWDTYVVTPGSPVRVFAGDS